MNKDKLLIGLAIVIVGGVSYKIAKEIRYRRLQKEMYGEIEVIDDEQ